VDGVGKQGEAARKDPACDLSHGQREIDEECKKDPPVACLRADENAAVAMRVRVAGVMVVIVVRHRPLCACWPQPFCPR
jgi:hypothetical protein